MSDFENEFDEQFKLVKFRGNSNLTKPDTEVLLEEEQFKFYTAEIIRCKNDPIYFAEKYYTIVHPKKGKHVIKLYDKQRELINVLINNSRVICCSSRQVGKCVFKDSKITVRNKTTGKIEELTMEEFENKHIYSFSTNHEKFIKSYIVYDYEVLTDTGWEDIKFLHKTVPYVEWKVKTENHDIICADDHILFRKNYDEVLTKNLNIGDEVITESGPEPVISIEESTELSNMYDLELSSNSNKRYYTNGILSHNTTSYAIFALHLLCFSRDKKILILANKRDTATEIIGRIKLAFELLPKWLKPGVKIWNRGSIELSNGCAIEGIATSPDAARGKSANILIFDELAFCAENLVEEVWTSVYPIISSAVGTKAIIVSTPNGTGNLFYNIWQKSINHVNTNDNDDLIEERWVPYKIDWWEVPDRDENWKKLQIESFNGDLVKFAQEFGNQFIGSTYTLITRDILEKLESVVRRPESTKTLKINEFEIQIFVEPIEGHCYVIGADSATGAGADCNEFTCYDITEGYKNIVQCFKFSSNTCMSAESAFILAKMGTMYNKALMMIESNSTGHAIIQFLYLLYEYENIASLGSKQLGILSNYQLKTKACLNFKRYLEAFFDNIKIYDEKLVDELKMFEQKKSPNSDRVTYSAQGKNHDDTVMANIWAFYALTQEVLDYFFEVEWVNENYEMLPVSVKQFDSSNNQADIVDVDKVYDKISKFTKNDVDLLVKKKTNNETLQDAGNDEEQFKFLGFYTS